MWQSRRLQAVRHAAEPAIRRGMHLYWRLARPMTLGVRGMVLNPVGEVLLVQHSYVGGWHMPGGGVEAGETLVAALARELAEEANVTLAGPPALHGMFFNVHVSRRDHVAVYVVRAFVQQPGPVRDREIVAHGFFPADAVPADTTPGTRRRLAEVLQAAPVSAHW